MEQFELKTDRKPKLSDNILELKFMQRQQERALREKLERERSKALGEAQWVAFYDELDVGKPKFNVEYLPSYLSFTKSEVKNGRLSFGRFKSGYRKAPTVKIIDEQNETLSNSTKYTRSNNIQVRKRKYENIQSITLDKNSRKKDELELDEVDSNYELEEGEIPQKIAKVKNEINRKFLKPPE
ncbi:hypothetical protein RhiirA5_503998 [Rhizophagus irregularis]|uniref:Uncharacterized protein n=3 Tax=Rhizophagus irregularis TaxID=588596 RepID=U9UL83_RHIID|nr:hypothetical protein GLOIN_2v1538905 [Rhizophagus irregularis DAOM 181602=DAOM 197198]EXX50716.1 hypothetical protein RirG_268200 [Rhizophagus irregularis DAOM 197198w]PKC02528.1 hypothetical protein RhiirA5_503998 [Rhizophagus irregularis]PKC59426.1 hypothetical protein RhiirA1_445426 [Rhizophagus irregularis]PKK62393.1 hypothetical protein RhiirC2_855713 [Rhizophagus irregularis]PKY28152.1 hypothetical protein RhiirB3_529680 [Rhizophagus irregularis]|eukprot:XP_025185257.1 hypothetical protein GLOIN_2v1538905 [Rhizophagus irregularis DAOM 181602=DAOM 197198]